MSWAGHAWFGSGVLVYSGSVGSTDAHHHSAHQVLLLSDTGAPVHVEVDGTDIGPVRRLVIPSGAAHRLSAPAHGSSGLTVYLDVDTADGRIVADCAARGNDWSSSSDLLRALTTASTDDDVAAALESTIRSAQVHRYVRRAIEVARDTLPAQLSLAELASEICVSAPHLSRLWRNDLGLTFNAWVRWERIRIAVAHVKGGASVTDAVHRAGFADSAHASRVFREMFGLTPSELRAAVTLV